MGKEQMLIQDQLSGIGVIPVIKLKEIADAGALAEALCAGSLPAAEVTFRAEGAEQVIRGMREASPDLLVGAGTVLSVRQAELAQNAGARFVVSPGYDEEVVTWCVQNGMPVFPGCVTPTEIQMAIKRGLSVIKFFPAQQFGGLSAINALAGPFAEIRFMPTGGIDLTNLADYAANRHVAACGGSFMVAEKLIVEKNWSEITRLCKEAVEIVRKARDRK